MLLWRREGFFHHSTISASPREGSWQSFRPPRGMNGHCQQQDKGCAGWRRTGGCVGVQVSFCSGLESPGPRPPLSRSERQCTQAVHPTFPFSPMVQGKV